MSARKPASRKAPAWLPKAGRKPAAPAAKPKGGKPHAQDIDTALDGKDGEPVVVAQHDEAYLAARLKAIREASTPICEAAHELLRAQAEIPLRKRPLRRRQVETLRALLEQGVQNFERLCAQADIERDKITVASYTLCAALDEAVMHTAWGGGTAENGLWARMSLSSQFHGDRDGGTKVYRLIARASEDPQGQHDLIRLYFRVMCLGFKGYYRTQPDGDQQHRMACRKLYDLLAPFQPPVPKELSINIAPTRERNFYPMRLIPFPVTIAVYALALLALYGYFRYELHVKEKALLEQLEQIREMVVPLAYDSPFWQAQGGEAGMPPQAEPSSQPPAQPPAGSPGHAGKPRD